MATRYPRVAVTPRTEMQKSQWEMYAERYGMSVSQFMASTTDWFIYLHSLMPEELLKECVRIADYIVLRSNDPEIFNPRKTL